MTKKEFEPHLVRPKALQGQDGIAEEEKYTLRLAARALEKQCPQPPVFKDADGNVDPQNGMLVCPSCDALGIIGCKYCPHCGQRIDWSGGEED